MGHTHSQLQQHVQHERRAELPDTSRHHQSDITDTTRSRCHINYRHILHSAKYRHILHSAIPYLGAVP